MGAPFSIRWDTDRDNELRALNAEGMSAAQVAEKMGGTTRGAVIGRLSRLRVMSANSPQANQATRAYKPRRKRSRAEQIKTDQNFGGGMTQRMNNRANAEPIEPHQTSASLAEFNATCPEAQHVTIMGLTNETCRFPMWSDGDRSGFYCGRLSADLSEGRPFCQAHAAHCYNGKSSAKPWLPGRP